MKLFCSFRYVLALAIGGLVATSSPFVSVAAFAQTPAITVAQIITTIAGDGNLGFGGDAGSATAANLSPPVGVAADAAGNIYIADTYNNRIRRVDTSGNISTVAGNGTPGFGGDGNSATNALLNGPTRVALDAAGNIYITDSGNHRVRKVDSSGTISTVAGNGTQSFSGDGGPATSATLNSPTGVAVDAAGNIYIADTNNNRIRKVIGTTISTVAGNGTAGFAGDGGPATSATLNFPVGVALDSAGNIYIVDGENSRIRKVTGTTISTVAGNGTAGFAGDGGPATSAQLYAPTGIAVDAAGNLYIADTINQRIRKVTGTTISTVAGTGGLGFSGDGGLASNAELLYPEDVAAGAAGNIYIADTYNNRIRKVSQSIPPFPDTQVGQSSSVQNIFLQINQTLTIASYTIPQGEGGQQEFTIGTVTGCPLGTPLVAGTLCTIPITFSPQYPGKRDTPLPLITSSGNFNFGLIGTGIGPQVAILPGIINTIAGTGGGDSGDGGQASAAGILVPSAIARDASGTTFVVTSARRVRKIYPNGVITTIANVNNSANTTGDGGPAVNAGIGLASGLALDAAGNIYISDIGGYTIRKIDANGIISRFAGNGNNGASGDNGPATSAGLTGGPLAVDSLGNLLIADQSNYRIRKVDTNGIITTVVGTGTSGTSGDGGLAINARITSAVTGIAVDRAGNLYIADQGTFSVRKVDATTGIINTIVGGPGVPITTAGVPALGASLKPQSVSVDAAGNLYIPEHQSPIMYRMDAGSNIIRRIAGTGAFGFSGDGGPATVAQFSGIPGLTLDGAGNIYIPDQNNNRIRQINLQPSTIRFPNTTIGQTAGPNSPPPPFFVSNIGNGELNLGSLAVTPADFLVSSSDTCSTVPTLAAGNSCTLALQFNPQQGGARTGTVTMTDDALNVPNSTQIIQLSGTGLAVATMNVLSLSTSSSIDAATPVKLTANVTPFSAGAVTTTGTMSFFDGATLLGTAPVSATGEASITVPSFTVGSHSLTAVYAGDSNFSPSTSAAVPLTVSTVPIAIEVSSSDNPSNYGQSVTFTAKVPSGATGTVNFFDGATQIGGPVTISGTAASFATSTLALGGHNITARYSGDGTHATATSGVLNQIVNPAMLTVTATSATRPYDEPNPTFTYTITGFVGSDTQSVVSGTPQITTTATEGSIVGSYPVTASLGTLGAGSYTFIFVPGTLTITKATPGGDARTLGLSAICSPNPSVWGQMVTCTATLPANATGQVNFAEGSVMLGTGTIVDEHASFTTSQLAVGTHSVAAAYGGDTNYNGASSPAVSQVVNKATLSVIATDQQRLYGQVNPPLTTTTSGFVNGDTGAAVAGVPVTTTTATATSPPGSYPITVAQGTLVAANYNFVTVNGTLFVAAAAGTVTLTSSSPSAPAGVPVTFTATVPVGATGTVQFYDGATLIGTGTVSAGKATLTTSTLGLGTHSITAVYSGDVNFTTASSTVLTQVITAAPDYNVSSNTPRQLIPPGAAATYNIIISSVNVPFTNSVALTATGLPPGASYTFTPLTVTPGAAGVTSSFTVTVPKQTAGLRIRAMSPMALALLLLPWIWVKRKTFGPPRLLLWLLLSLTTLATLAGCGTGGYFSQAEQTYTITVTGTSGSLVRSTTVTLTVE